VVALGPEYFGPPPPGIGFGIALLAGLVALAVAFLISVWRAADWEPNEGWERNDSLWPQIGEASPRPDPSTRDKARDRRHRI
jgi:hypothetical protein